jgi:hypothetical protein
MCLTDFIHDHPLIWDIFIAIVTGVVASFMYEQLVSWRRDRRLRAEFSKWQGTYHEIVWNAENVLASTGGSVRLTYCGGTKFTTEGIDKKGNVLWHGEIFMREEAGVLGAGYYSYVKNDDTGIHQVIYNSKRQRFNVSGENTNRPDGKKFHMVWGPRT